MYSRFSDGRETVWAWCLWPLWLCFLWIGAGPFLSLYRVGPLSSFYLEAASLSGAAVLLLLTALTGRLNVKLPAASVYFLVLAAFWWLQARVMNLVYPGMSDMAVSAFITLALTAWACRGWIADVGQERVVSVFAWALAIGALIQAAVALMQFTGWASDSMFRGIIAYRGLREVNGQLGQRNHLGHYLMWGVLAASYLWSQRRMPGWLGLIWVLALTFALGLVNSRTIFTYVVGVGLLLPLWRLYAGRAANRIVVIIAFALMCTVAVQFGMSYLLDWLSGVQYDTALARVEGGSFGGSARDIEWHKAWTIFLSAPVWGHGWGSYAQQGFLIDGQADGFSNNLLNVLFTHSHNLILQLLSEMGLVGTLVVVLGFLAVIKRMFRRPANMASLLLLSLMAVSLCHSMLEYPLWYIYFLVPFAVMASLSPAQENDVADTHAVARRYNIGGSVLAVLILAAIVRLGFAYTDLTAFDRRLKNETAAQAADKINGLREIAANEPMLRYYAQLSLTRKVNPADSAIYSWAAEAAQQALMYRPYSSTYQVGLYRYRSGETQQAEQWLHHTYRYYPYMMPHYADKIRSNAVLKPLETQIAADCTTFRRQYPEAKTCEE
ncbi:PglL family O-oligosaccharyltransferase [Neisseria zalophi]|uniref:Polymerase n=1 Tax=Neisseria zalophi TaxID=640030 RepID=A0A5J6PTE0_9NEIS|nr:Wzy polymerase domain-containing protein [Neisseria zalophi]QEY25919.1 polymerase [Neisseria zalophi]